MMNEYDMPAPASDEVDLGLEEIEVPGESKEDPEIAEMISKLEELGYKVEKLDDMPDAEGDVEELDLEEDLEL